jgi:DNA-binding NarL/FixJ family response regulator
MPAEPTSRRVAAEDAHLAPTPGAAASAAGLARLTGRECEVLRLVAAGHSNRAIAQALAINEGTVNRHVHRLLGKLEAHSRTEAVARQHAGATLGRAAAVPQRPSTARACGIAPCT